MAGPSQGVQARAGLAPHPAPFDTIVLFANTCAKPEALHAESIRNLKLNMAKHQQAKSGQQSNLLDPRRIARLTASTNFRYSSSGGSFARGWANNRNVNAVQKARREAQQARQQRKVAIASINPTGPGGLPTRKLKIAPKGVRDQVRIQRQPLIAPRAPSKPQAPSPEEAERARREARLLAAKNPAAARNQTAGGSPAKPGEVARLAPSAAPKKSAPPKKVDSTSLLFPNGSKAAIGEQKVVVKTVSGSQNCADGSRARAAPATQQAPPDRARPTGSSANDRAWGQVGASNRPAEGRPVASSAVPAKRPAPPSSDGARSPPAPRSRKKRTEDLVFAKPKRR